MACAPRLARHSLQQGAGPWHSGQSGLRVERLWWSDGSVLYKESVGPQAAARLVAARHGDTAWSLAGRHTGRSDVALEPSGIEQAMRLGKRLAGHPFSAVLVRPAKRAIETCAAAGFGARAEVCEDLWEWDYGRYEGLTTMEIRAERPGWSIWRDGVPGGESIDGVAERADRVVARVRATLGDVLVVAHAHLLRVLAARWVAMPASAGAHLVLQPATLSVLGWEREAPAILSWNDGGPAPLGSA